MIGRNPLISDRNVSEVQIKQLKISKTQDIFDPYNKTSMTFTKFSSESRYVVCVMCTHFYKIPMHSLSYLVCIILCKIYAMCSITVT